VIGGQERGDAAFLRHVALRVERHERHDQRRGGVAAEKAVALGEDDARARLGGADRRAEAGGSPTDHQHIGLARERGATRRQIDRRAFVRPL
jgi:hypothetical protein